MTANITLVTETTAVVAARFLTPVVRSMQALAVNLKQAHWNVQGANFLTIHELLDIVATDARDAADITAERVVALGLPIDARLTKIADTVCRLPSAQSTHHGKTRCATSFATSTPP